MRSEFKIGRGPVSRQPRGIDTLPRTRFNCLAGMRFPECIIQIG
jgi:hypothetical protein